jgi:hypothetical protein
VTLPPPTTEPTQPGNGGGGGGPKPTKTPNPSIGGYAAAGGGIVPGALLPLAVPIVFIGLGRLFRPIRPPSRRR